MKTSITTFQEKITGNLEFPIMTDYGIINDVNLGMYLRTQSELGNAVSSPHLNALRQFVSTAKTEGWYDSLLYVMPFLVLENKKSVAIPLVANAGKRLAATVGVSSQGYDSETNFGQFIAVNAKGVIPVTGKALTLQLTTGDLYTKGQMNAYRNQSLFGVSLYGKYVRQNNTRMWGGKDITDKMTRMGVAANGNLETYQFGEVFSYPQAGTDLESVNYINGWSIVRSSNKIIRVEYGNLSGSLTDNESGNRTDTILTDLSQHNANRIAVNAAWRDEGNVQNGAEGQELYYLAFHDGTITDARYPGYRIAVSALMSALGK